MRHDYLHGLFAIVGVILFFEVMFVLLATIPQAVVFVSVVPLAVFTAWIIFNIGREVLDGHR